MVSQRLSPELRKIIGNTGWLFADRILRMGIGLVVGVWVARYLGPEQFGLYNYAVAFVALFSTLATLGLDQIVVRDIVHNPSCRNETLGTAFVLKFLSGTGVLLLTMGIISRLRPGDSLSHWLVAVTAAGTIFQAFDAIDFWFRSQVQSKYTVYAKNTAFVFTTIIKVVLIHQEAPLIMFAWAGLTEMILSSVGLVISYRLSGHALQAWHGSLKRAKHLLKDSWPLILSGLAIIVYMRIDQIMLGEMVGDEAVGIYSAATRVSEVWYFIPTAVVSSVFPAIIEAKKISEALYYRRLQKLFRLMVALALGVAIPMTFLSKTLVVLLFGNNYVAAGPVLAIHIWAALFVFLGVAQGPWDITEGLTKLSFQRTLIGAIANVLLNLVLIPFYSSLGAAVATVASYGFAAFITNAVDQRTRGIFLLQARSILFIK